MNYKHRHSEYTKEKIASKTLDKELIWRLLTYLRPYRFLLFMAIFFLIISKIIEASIPIFLGHVSQQILDGMHLAVSVKEELLRHVVTIGSLIIAMLLMSYVFDSLNVILKSWIGQKSIYQLRTQIYEHILHMPLAYFDKHTVGRLMTRTIHDVDQINQMFAESVIPIFGNIVLFISIFVGIFFINWKIGLLVLFLLPIVYLLTRYFRIHQRRCYDRIRTVVAAMNTFMQENLMGAATIRNFGLQKNARKHFEKINEDHCNAYVESVQNFSFFIAGIDFLQNFSLIMAFAILAVWIPMGDSFEAGTYFTFSLYVVMFFRPLVDLAERYNVLQSAMAASARLFDVIDREPETNESTGKNFLKEIETISFENVWFAYEEERWILQGLSFHIRKGESVALVGMTGQGKSTIISLLLQFYKHQKGDIKINGIDIRKYSLHSLRKQFSIVLQDPVLFSGSIADNIALFNPSITHSHIEETIDYLGMRQFIMRLNQGINHRLIERGKSLSMGEMQLLSLARAVAHQRTVLILDEATANIDTNTERVIQAALQKILHEKTAFVIAHRLSTIKNVSRILVLHDGKIAESGTHSELLNSKGIYEKLYRLQS
ncbi:MAG: ABC transporter ATP-binding protein [Parachlamydiaceae bacterium]|nr:ABC transporter ATP-binding protein [Parachlamydiaceae bacterium]